MLVAGVGTSGDAQRAAEAADEATAGPRELRLLHSLFALEALDGLGVLVLAPEPFRLGLAGCVEAAGDRGLQAGIRGGWERAVQGSVLSLVPGGSGGLFAECFGGGRCRRRCGFGAHYPSQGHAVKDGGIADHVFSKGLVGRHRGKAWRVRDNQVQHGRYSFHWCPKNERTNPYRCDSSFAIW